MRGEGGIKRRVREDSIFTPPTPPLMDFKRRGEGKASF
jgi:hypothetical protein